LSLLRKLGVPLVHRVVKNLEKVKGLPFQVGVDQARGGVRLQMQAAISQRSQNLGGLDGLVGLRTKIGFRGRERSGIRACFLWVVLVPLVTGALS
jgi:hypothetical protein